MTYYVDCPHCRKEISIEASVDWAISYTQKEKKE